MPGHWFEISQNQLWAMRHLVFFIAFTVHLIIDLNRGRPAMPPVLPEAGPSKRTAHFASEASDEDDHHPASPLVKRQALSSNGNGNGERTPRKVAKINGHGGVKLSGERQRKERAELLFRTRQELPFYQGA